MTLLKRSTFVPPFYTPLHIATKGINMLTFKENKGQGLVEYALILVLVAVVVIVILALLGPAIGNVFSTIVSKI
jgi:pilus assembly protein Flp/PilA